MVTRTEMASFVFGREITCRYLNYLVGGVQNYLGMRTQSHTRDHMFSYFLWHLWKPSLFRARRCIPIKNDTKYFCYQLERPFLNIAS